MIVAQLFGGLFWERNLETAIAAHAGFHVGAALLVVGVRIEATCRLAGSYLC